MVDLDRGILVHLQIDQLHSCLDVTRALLLIGLVLHMASHQELSVLCHRSCLQT